MRWRPHWRRLAVVAAPRSGADGIDRSIRITKSPLDHLGLLGSGYLRVPARVLSSTRRARDGRKCHALPPSDPSATAALNRDRRAPGQPSRPAAEPDRRRRRRRHHDRCCRYGSRGHGWRSNVPRQADGGGAWRLGRQRQLGAGGGPPSTQRLPRGRPPTRCAVCPTTAPTWPPSWRPSAARSCRSATPTVGRSSPTPPPATPTSRRNGCRGLHPRPGPDVVGAGHRRARLLRGR